MTKVTRVMIVDDHPLVAEGIEAILESFDDLEVAATLTNAQDAIDRIDELAPDVVLLDINMPGLNGLQATEIILEKSPDTRVLILSMHDTPEYISTALAHGASGYILKDIATDDIKTAIDAVMRGERYLCTGAVVSLTPEQNNTQEVLTSREQTILLHLARGATNKDVAHELGISVRTVETHRKNIRAKLGISSTAGLTRYAMEFGVIQNGDLELTPK